MPSWARHPVTIALTAPLVTAVALVPLRALVGPGALALLVMLAVVVVAMQGNRPASIVGAISGAVGFDVLLTEPYGSLAIAARNDAVAAGVLLAAGVAVGELSIRNQHHQRLRAAREGEIGRMYYAAELATLDTPLDRLVDVVARELTELLGLRHCRFERGQAFAPSATIDHEGRVRMGDLAWDSSTGLPGGPVALEVLAAGMLVGRFVLDPTPARPVEPYQLLVAVALADQVGAVIGRWPLDTPTGATS